MYLFHPLFSYIYKHIAQVGLDQNNQKEKIFKMQPLTKS